MERRTFSNESLAGFSTADALQAHGLSAPKRGPCPFCNTSTNSQSFLQSGATYHCFACGKTGNAVGLYSDLAGIPYAQGVQAVASILGLSPDDPVAVTKAANARRQAEAEARERDEIESVRWRARLARRDRLRAAIAGIPDCTPLSWSVLGNLYAALGRVEDWIESREYAMKGWL